MRSPARSTVRPLIWSREDEARPPCTVRRCPHRAYYIIGLRVVSGGREFRREERRCSAHAQTFAERQHLTWPPR